LILANRIAEVKIGLHSFETKETNCLIVSLPKLIIILANDPKISFVLYMSLLELAG
jgi:hypothetical protein